MSAAEIIDGLRSAGNTSMRASVSPHSEFTPASKLANSAESETDDTVSFSALGLYQLISRTPDMYQLYLKSGDKQRFSEICYDREAELLGRTPSEYAEVEFEDWLAALKTGCMLEDWACEVDEDRLTERYGVGPGDIRGKVETAQWLLEATEQLADEVGTDQLPIREAKMRVTYGVREELLPLANIPQIGRKRARLLFDAGIESRADLRVTAKSVILRALRGRRKTAETILENVGREDPSMDGVDDANEMSPISDETNTTSESTTDTRDQANLGDFD
jgi:Superfamily II helicase